MVIWLTGLSDSGKTSISKEFLRISSKENKFISIDGDDIRLIFNNKLGFSKPERIKHINHIQKLAKFLEQNHIMVIVSALYCNSDILKWNRKNLQRIRFYSWLVESLFYLDKTASTDIKQEYKIFNIDYYDFQCL